MPQQGPVTQSGRLQAEPAGFLAEAACTPYEIVAQGGPPRSAVRVSVIVPTLNRAGLVNDTVHALFQQDLTPQAYEVIVVDDASEDDTVQVLQRAAAISPCTFTALRLRQHGGKAITRNLGVVLAQGEVVAFTDSDCIPSPGWLRACLDGLVDGVAIVQGRTLPPPDQRRPLFSHFIQTTGLDGSYSTSNIAYLREAFLAGGGFDGACSYWEDVDLGWRVRRLGWPAIFMPRALVYHQVIPLSLREWLLWPRHFAATPAKAARYPEFRRHLFLGLWVDWFHALFDLAVLAAPLALLVHRGLGIVALPYVVAFPFRHGLRGRWPLAKATLHLAWDAVSFGVLLTSSARHRSLVL